MGFFNLLLFSMHPNFPQSKYIMLLTIGGGGGGRDIRSMTIFLELLNNVHENDFLKQNFENRFGPIIIFSPPIRISLSIIIK
jgi:hypothetical protein